MFAGDGVVPLCRQQLLVLLSTFAAASGNEVVNYHLPRITTDAVLVAKMYVGYQKRVLGILQTVNLKLSVLEYSVFH